MSVSSISIWDDDLFDSSSYFLDADGDEYSTMSLTMGDIEDDDEEILGEEECRKYAAAEISSTYTHIKKMNNEVATSLMEMMKNNISGGWKGTKKKEKYNHDKAIVKLDQALKILRPVDDITMNYFETETCTCHCCSLDGCIECTEKLEKKEKTSKKISRSTTNSFINELLQMKKKLRDIKKKKKTNETQKECHKEDEEEDDFHRTPICIPEHSIIEGHNMGSTLFLIITFNLTLAHHLKVLEKIKQKQKQKEKKKSSSNDSSSSLSSSLLILMKGTIQLYKVLLKSIMKADDASIEESMDNNNKSKERFVQIVQKNMDHLVKSKNDAMTAIIASSKKGQKQQQSESILVVDNLSLHDNCQNPKAVLPLDCRRPSTDSSSIALISLKEDENNNNNLSSRIRKGVKTSFSFIQSQQPKTIRCANAA